MNRQGTKSDPRGGIEWTHIFGPRSGYTSNPVKGCQHACRWRMPDGKLAVCYAETTAERFPGKHYKNGFGQISFDARELDAIRKLKNPSGIFIDSMSDLFGKNVKDEWIFSVIDTIYSAPMHVFFSLTKNASRFRQFQYSCEWPAHWWVGISSPPTFMFGHELLLIQQEVWFKCALEFLRDSPAQRRWVSLEPLSFDAGAILEKSNCPLDWAVIGAATNGAQTHQPSEKFMVNALQALNARKIPVFMKGNLSRKFVGICGSEWREEFPKIKGECPLMAGNEQKL
jgi:protein gp37